MGPIRRELLREWRIGALKKPDIFIPVGRTQFGVASILMQPAGKPASVEVENFRVTAPSGR